MGKHYIVFRSDGPPVRSEQCTTPWPSDITCSIVLSGMVNNTYHNLMIMVGDDDKIQNWLNANPGKVSEVTKAEMDALGQQIIPPGTERTIRANEMFPESPDGDKVFVATEFDSDNPTGLWVEKTE